MSFHISVVFLDQPLPKTYPEYKGIYIYIYIYIHTHTHTHVFMYVVCVCVCVFKVQSNIDLK